MPEARRNNTNNKIRFTFGGSRSRTRSGNGYAAHSTKPPVKAVSFLSDGSKRKGQSRIKDKNGITMGILLLCFGILLIFCGAVALGGNIIYCGGIVALIVLAYLFYRVGKLLDTDRIERMASIIYSDNPEEDYNALKVFLGSRRMLKSLPQDINALEKEAMAYVGEEPAALCGILAKRERLNRMYRRLLEIQAEPDFYKPSADSFYAHAIKTYIKRSFSPVYKAAEYLETEEEKKAVYVRYVDRFAGCYEEMPGEARHVVRSFMKTFDIAFSAASTELRAEA